MKAKHIANAKNAKQTCLRVQYNAYSVASGRSVKDCNLMVREIVQKPLRIQKKKKTEN